MNHPVVFAGSFDPVTNGHLDIIRRARTIFGEVIVLLMPNAQKKTLFTLEERAALIKEALAGETGVQVVTAEGLLVNFLKEHNLRVVVRGVRNASDWDYEMRNEAYNKLFYPELETVILPARTDAWFISSSGVKEAFKYGADISSLVPPCALKALQKKLKI